MWQLQALDHIASHQHILARSRPLRRVQGPQQRRLTAGVVCKLLLLQTRRIKSFSTRYCASHPLFCPAHHPFSFTALSVRSGASPPPQPASERPHVTHPLLPPHPRAALSQKCAPAHIVALQDVPDRSARPIQCFIRRSQPAWMPRSAI